MTLEQIKKMEYQGGGYFREKGPKGKKMPTVHAPELVAVLIKMLEEKGD